MSLQADSSFPLMDPSEGFNLQTILQSVILKLDRNFHDLLENEDFSRASEPQRRKQLRMYFDTSHSLLIRLVGVTSMAKHSLPISPYLEQINSICQHYFSQYSSFLSSLKTMFDIIRSDNHAPWDVTLAMRVLYQGGFHAAPRCSYFPGPSGLMQPSTIPASLHPRITRAIHNYIRLSLLFLLPSVTTCHFLRLYTHNGLLFIFRPFQFCIVAQPYMLPSPEPFATSSIEQDQRRIRWRVQNLFLTLSVAPISHFQQLFSDMPPSPSPSSSSSPLLSALPAGCFSLSSPLQIAHHLITAQPTSTPSFPHTPSIPPLIFSAIDSFPCLRFCQALNEKLADLVSIVADTSHNVAQSTSPFTHHVPETFPLSQTPSPLQPESTASAMSISSSVSSKSFSAPQYHPVSYIITTVSRFFIQFAFNLLRKQLSFRTSLLRNNASQPSSSLRRRFGHLDAQLSPFGHQTIPKKQLKLFYLGMPPNLQPSDPNTSDSTQTIVQAPINPIVQHLLDTGFIVRPSYAVFFPSLTIEVSPIDKSTSPSTSSPSSIISSLAVASPELTKQSMIGPPPQTSGNDPQIYLQPSLFYLSLRHEPPIADLPTSLSVHYLHIDSFLSLLSRRVATSQFSALNSALSRFILTQTTLYLRSTRSAALQQQQQTSPKPTITQLFNESPLGIITIQNTLPTSVAMPTQLISRLFPLFTSLMSFLPPPAPFFSEETSPTTSPHASSLSAAEQSASPSPSPPRALTHPSLLLFVQRAGYSKFTPVISLSSDTRVSLSIAGISISQALTDVQPTFLLASRLSNVPQGGSSALQFIAMAHPSLDISPTATHYPVVEPGAKLMLPPACISSHLSEQPPALASPSSSSCPTLQLLQLAFNALVQFNSALQPSASTQSSPAPSSVAPAPPSTLPLGQYFSCPTLPVYLTFPPLSQYSSRLGFFHPAEVSDFADLAAPQHSDEESIGSNSNDPGANQNASRSFISHNVAVSGRHFSVLQRQLADLTRKTILGGVTSAALPLLTALHHMLSVQNALQRAIGDYQPSQQAASSPSSSSSLKIFFAADFIFHDYSTSMHKYQKSPHIDNYFTSLLPQHLHNVHNHHAMALHHSIIQTLQANSIILSPHVFIPGVVASTTPSSHVVPMQTTTESTTPASVGRPLYSALSSHLDAPVTEPLLDDMTMFVHLFHQPAAQLFSQLLRPGFDIFLAIAPTSPHPRVFDTVASLATSQQHLPQPQQYGQTTGSSNNSDVALLRLQQFPFYLIFTRDMSSRGQHGIVQNDFSINSAPLQNRTVIAMFPLIQLVSPSSQQSPLATPAASTTCLPSFARLSNDLTMASCVSSLISTAMATANKIVSLFDLYHFSVFAPLANPASSFEPLALSPPLATHIPSPFVTIASDVSLLNHPSALTFSVPSIQLTQYELVPRTLSPPFQPRPSAGGAATTSSSVGQLSSPFSPIPKISHPSLSFSVESDNTIRLSISQVDVLQALWSIYDFPDDAQFSPDTISWYERQSINNTTSSPILINYHSEYGSLDLSMPYSHRQSCSFSSFSSTSQFTPFFILLRMFIQFVQLSNAIQDIFAVNIRLALTPDLAFGNSSEHILTSWLALLQPGSILPSKASLHDITLKYTPNPVTRLDASLFSTSLLSSSSAALLQLLISPPNSHSIRPVVVLPPNYLPIALLATVQSPLLSLLVPQTLAQAGSFREEVPLTIAAWSHLTRAYVEQSPQSLSALPSQDMADDVLETLFAAFSNIVSSHEAQDSELTVHLASPHDFHTVKRPTPHSSAMSLPSTEHHHFLPIPSCFSSLTLSSLLHVLSHTHSISSTTIPSSMHGLFNTIPVVKTTRPFSLAEWSAIFATTFPPSQQSPLRVQGLAQWSSLSNFYSGSVWLSFLIHISSSLSPAPHLEVFDAIQSFLSVSRFKNLQHYSNLSTSRPFENIMQPVFTNPILSSSRHVSRLEKLTRSKHLTLLADSATLHNNKTERVTNDTSAGSGNSASSSNSGFCEPPVLFDSSISGTIHPRVTVIPHVQDAFRLQVTSSVNTSLLVPASTKPPFEGLFPSEMFPAGSSPSTQNDVQTPTPLLLSVTVDISANMCTLYRPDAASTFKNLLTSRSGTNTTATSSPQHQDFSLLSFTPSVMNPLLADHHIYHVSALCFILLDALHISPFLPTFTPSFVPRPDIPNQLMPAPLEPKDIIQFSPLGIKKMTQHIDFLAAKNVLTAPPINFTVSLPPATPKQPVTTKRISTTTLNELDTLLLREKSQLPFVHSFQAELAKIEKSLDLLNKQYQQLQQQQQQQQQPHISQSIAHVEQQIHRAREDRQKVIAYLNSGNSKFAIELHQNTSLTGFSPNMQFGSLPDQQNTTGGGAATVTIGPGLSIPVSIISAISSLPNRHVSGLALSLHLPLSFDFQRSHLYITERHNFGPIAHRMHQRYYAYRAQQVLETYRSRNASPQSAAFVQTMLQDVYGQNISGSAQSTASTTSGGHARNVAGSSGVTGSSSSLGNRGRGGTATATSAVVAASSNQPAIFSGIPFLSSNITERLPLLMYAAQALKVQQRGGADNALHGAATNTVILSALEVLAQIPAQGRHSSDQMLEAIQRVAAQTIVTTCLERLSMTNVLNAHVLWYDTTSLKIPCYLHSFHLREMYSAAFDKLSLRSWCHVAPFLQASYEWLLSMYLHPIVVAAAENNSNQPAPSPSQPSSTSNMFVHMFRLYQLLGLQSRQSQRITTILQDPMSLYSYSHLHQLTMPQFNAELQCFGSHPIALMDRLQFGQRASLTVALNAGSNDVPAHHRNSNTNPSAVSTMSEITTSSASSRKLSLGSRRSTVAATATAAAATTTAVPSSMEGFTRPDKLTDTSSASNSIRSQLVPFISDLIINTYTNPIPIQTTGSVLVSRGHTFGDALAAFTEKLLHRSIETLLKQPPQIPVSYTLVQPDNCLINESADNRRALTIQASYSSIAPSSSSYRRSTSNQHQLQQQQQQQQQQYQQQQYQQQQYQQQQQHPQQQQSYPPQYQQQQPQQAAQFSQAQFQQYRQVQPQQQPPQQQQPSHPATTRINFRHHRPQ